MLATAVSLPSISSRNNVAVSQKTRISRAAIPKFQVACKANAAKTVTTTQQAPAPTPAPANFFTNPLALGGAAVVAAGALFAMKGNKGTEKRTVSTPKVKAEAVPVGEITEGFTWSAPEDVKEKALISSNDVYDAMYKESIEDPSGFWSKIADQFYWEKEWDRSNVVTSNMDVNAGKVDVKWFEGGKTNMAYNCLDKHIEEGKGDKVAFFFEPNEPTEEKISMTYKEVKEEVCRVANWLKSKGVKKGDRVVLYMPMVMELPIAMLACARIGAIHSVVFGGFSSEALANRIFGAEADVVCTCSSVMRGKKSISLKAIVDRGLELAAEMGVSPKSVLMYDNKSAVEREDVAFTEGRDYWWQDAVKDMSTDCPVEWMDAEDPLFTLYTSGSTGMPKGVVHTTGGYMVYAATTFKYVFDYQDGDVFWCTADCGWITGHTYLTYGPMLNGATQIVFEGVPTYPDAGRSWDVCTKYDVSQYYTAPTLVRSLMRAGNEVPDSYNLDSLRVLGSVGEPINPEAWKWYHTHVGKSRCPIVDTYWQTESGAHLLTPLPGAFPQKPGSATKPFFGVDPVLLTDKGVVIEGAGEGLLAIKSPWPSMFRTLWNDHDRYATAYFSAYPGYYFTGDGARRDEDGYYWITGRVDDVINVSGHRIGTAEVESALVGHPACAEAAVVPIEHPVKGQAIYAYVTLMEGVEPSDDIRKALVTTVRSIIGPFAAPDTIHWAPGLPKTRSGKIMRRILRKIASNEVDQLGDTSTLAEPAIVDTLIDLRGK